MKAIEPGTVKRALSAHAAIGLLTAALLYLVCLTGALAVFAPDLQRIEQRGVPEMAAIDPQALQRAVETVLASGAGKPPASYLYVHLPVPDMPRTVLTSDNQSVVIDRDGRVFGPEQVAWTSFLGVLHYALNLPALVGGVLVGVLGAMMLALTISGVTAHPRIFRDAFRLRARDPGGVGLADWHNRLSVWTLPFGIAIALTGAIIGLAGVTALAIAGLSGGSDVEAVYVPVFGPDPKPDKTPAPMPNVAAALGYMRAHYPQVAASFITLTDPRTAGQRIQVRGLHSRRLIFGEYYNFAGDGRFLGTAGLADGAVGQQIAASNYRLHFGDYGGLPVKLAYLLFGAALSAICATGTFIWLGKRRRRGVHEPRLRAAWHGVVWGGPAALGLTFVARLIGGNGLPFAGIFWAALAVFVLGAVLSVGPSRRAGLSVTA